MTTLRVSFLFLVGLAMTQAVRPWINEYDKPMLFSCPAGQVVMYESSIHSSDNEDRIWEMYCRSVPASTTNCVTSGWVNDFDKPVSFTCPDNKVWTGVESYHENDYEDRRYKYTCCTASNRPLSNCYFTDYVNEFDGKATLFVPEGQAVRSIFSFHDNGREDRRYRYEICTL